LRNVDGLLPRLLAARNLMLPIVSELGDAEEGNGLGTAYGNVAKDRSGAQADLYFTRVFQTFERTAQDAESLDQIQHNLKIGEEREKLLERAWGHAMESEALSPTMGAYNLACIAAERGDWDTMAHWLHISAREARFPGPSHTDQITSFNQVRDKQWFNELLKSLYPISRLRLAMLNAGRKSHIKIRNFVQTVSGR
jgi:hypothetical protein